MSSGRSAKGYWWSPETPGERWFGTLEQASDGISLTCHAEANALHPLADKPGVTIHGQNENGKPVSLLLVSRTKKETSGGMTSVTLHPGCVLEGVHTPERDTFRGLAVDIQIQRLHDWLGLTGFGHGVNADCSGNITISYARPESLRHDLGDGLNMEFGLLTNLVCTAQEQSICEQVSITFSRKSGLTYAESKELTTALRALLHLAVLKPVYAVGMTFRGIAGQEQPCGMPPAEVGAWTGDFREQIGERMHPGMWVFRYEDVAQDFGDFFAKWLSYRQDYDEPLGCYTTTVYHSLPITVKHLCLTQALDAYHGVRFKSHDQRGFKGKIEKLCNLHPEALSGLESNVALFAAQVRDTRDYLTHHNPDDLLKRDVVKGHAELIRLNEKLKILFQSCVLTDMGIPNERLARLRQQMASSIIEY